MKSIILIISIFSFNIFAQNPSPKAQLRRKIETIITSKKAEVGVAITALESNETLSINGDKHYPMQSVFKAHLAIVALSLVDKSKLALDQPVFVKKSDLLPTYSPLRDKYPNGNVSVSLAGLIRYTVSQSDNNGCDILFRLVGGTKKVNDFFKKSGLKDISIVATEEEMAKNWGVQFSNWSTANATNQLLVNLFNNQFLSKPTHDFLIKTLEETSTGANRIKGLLPIGTTVAHKTGSSSTDDKGITVATNDVGVITLPNGKHFVISVYVTNSKEDANTNAQIIAKITKAAWDYFTTTNK
jgi:beta-lactamase class A